MKFGIKNQQVYFREHIYGWDTGWGMTEISELGFQILPALFESHTLHYEVLCPKVCCVNSVFSCMKQKYYAVYLKVT